MNTKYKVWECKIVVPIDSVFPKGFDLPPRTSAIETVEITGVKVISCFSGWGGDLTTGEERIVDEDADTMDKNKPFKDPVHLIGTEKDKNTFRN